MFQNEVTQIELAEELGVSESTVYRMLAKRLNSEEKDHIREVVDRIISLR